MANKTPGSERPWLERARKVKKRVVTPRMRKYAENRAAGLAPAQAAKEAGYRSPHRQGQWLESSNAMVQYNRDVLAASGIYASTIGDKIREGLDAMRAVYVLIQDEREFKHAPGTKEREEEERKRDREPKKTLIKEEDWHARHKYVETAINMAGLKPEIQTKLMIEAQVNVDVTHRVVPVVPQAMMEAWETMTPEEKAKALTERARKRITGTLQEDPVALNPPDSAGLQPLTPYVESLPGEITSDD